MLTQAYVREILRYDPSTGIFQWRAARRGIRKGQRAGSLSVHGYYMIMIDGRLYRAGRLAWLWVHGRWPDPEIDHENTITSDDRLDNLREATRSQNRANRRRQKNNTIGFKGVKRTPAGRYQARIWKDGRCVYLGTYDRAAEAGEAHAAAAHRVHGDFARRS